MLNTFLEKTEGLLNRHFLVAYWFPTFVVTVAALALRAWVFGWAEVWDAWQGLVVGEDSSTRLWLVAALLLLTTLAAYVLQAFTRPLVQTYEGYTWPAWLRAWGIRRQQRRWARWRAAALEGPRPARVLAQDRLFHRYPARESQLMPTRLGNVLRAAESYGSQVYGLDVPFWWPRLWSILPEADQDGVQDALTGLVALLNLSLLLLVTAVDGAGYLFRVGHRVWWVIGSMSLILAYMSYAAALVQAQSYGQRVRAALDVHHLALIEALHIPAPATPTEERALWGQLLDWLYLYDLGAAHALSYKSDEAEADEDEAASQEAGQPEPWGQWLRKLFR